MRITVGDAKGIALTDKRKKVAEYLGTDHHELYITDKDALDVIPKLALMYDEPFADSSQIPTFLVSKLASEKVTVSLSGDAADELFGGYNRYALTHSLWNKISKLPLSIRIFFSKSLVLIKPKTYNLVIKILTFGKGVLNQANIGDKIHKAMNILSSKSHMELYDRLISLWPDSSSIVIGSHSFDLISENTQHQLMNFDNISKMMAIDLITYLPDDILCKVDRAAMSVSLETRVPFLDHRIMEYAWKLPLNFKIYQKKTKWVLREVLHKYVPPKLVERPKMGFGVPLDAWLRGELRPWAENLLSENRLLEEGFFDPKPIRKKWEEHLSGRRNWQHQLWVILIFQSWLEQNK
jgi:asparagine synthase (glutamine-hydrolysing)